MSFKDVLKQRSKKVTSTKALNKFSPYDVIIEPIFTEKTYNQGQNNIYYFKVNKESNKNDISSAIYHIYGFTPLKVNIQNVPKKERMRRGLVRRGYKKAIITLNDKDRIDLTK